MWHRHQLMASANGLQLIQPYHRRKLMKMAKCLYRKAGGNGVFESWRSKIMKMLMKYNESCISNGVSKAENGSLSYQ
jgi:hypothetical protein